MVILVLLNTDHLLNIEDDLYAGISNNKPRFNYLDKNKLAAPAYKYTNMILFSMHRNIV